MFKWFRVLRMFSTQNDVIAETEHKISILKEFAQELEKKTIELQNSNSELECKIRENIENHKLLADSMKRENEEQGKINELRRNEINDICQASEKYFNTFGEKVQQVSGEAKKQLTEIDEMVRNYENHVKELGTKLTELKEVVNDFQR